MPYRSKEASGRAAETTAKQRIQQKAETDFIEEPLMPLVLQTGVPDAGASDQNAGNKAERVSNAIKELKAIELEGQRRQHAVIGQPGHDPLSQAHHNKHIRMRHA